MCSGLQLTYDLHVGLQSINCGTHLLRRAAAVGKWYDKTLQVVKGDPPVADLRFLEELKDYIRTWDSAEVEARSEAKSGREEDASNKTRQRETTMDVFDELFSIVQGGFSLTSTGFIVYVADDPTSDLRASLIRKLVMPTTQLFFVHRFPLPSASKWTKRGRVLIRY